MASLEQKLSRAGDPRPAPTAHSVAEAAIVAKFVAAQPAARFFGSIFGSGRRFELVPTRANSQPALGAYVRGPDGTSHGVGLFVLTLDHEQICAMTRLENTVLPWFGLPRSLPSRVTL
jgi:hypothetical protein